MFHSVFMMNWKIWMESKILSQIPKTDWVHENQLHREIHIHVWWSPSPPELLHHDNTNKTSYLSATPRYWHGEVYCTKYQGLAVIYKAEIAVNHSWPGVARLQHDGPVRANCANFVVESSLLLTRGKINEKVDLVNFCSLNFICLQCF